ncbi:MULTISPECIES: ATP/GTP-binding protein [unclassified Streptomyces]|uniref:ATP/GTP-binding protein n=1 Tax=unclassified Streptomyces TaxID=2593676 RepID=UPI000939E44B|nr:ATP/GTP-binding protein [Streptomyces sp. TSRI0107]OKJ85575.1 ATP/GTP-binding protein [Streptomyces sp. TSRI0107]
MDGDGTRDARGTHANPVPRPAGPPEAPPLPPRPAHAPSKPSPTSIAGWLNEPRPETGPGIWRLGYRLRKDTAEQQRLSAVTIAGMFIPVILGTIIWSFWLDGMIPYQWAPLRLVTPDDWWEPATAINARPGGWGIEAFYAYRGITFAVLVWAMARLGSWGKAFRYYFARKPQPRRAASTVLGAVVVLALVFPTAFPGAFWDPVPVVDALINLTLALSQSYDLLQSPLFVYSLYTAVALLVIWPFARVGDWLPYVKGRLAARRATGPSAAPVPPAHWPALRDAGQHQAADLLTADVLAGRMNDVDCARLTRAWTHARSQGRLAEFTDAVLRHGSAALIHPSGARDLPIRSARHDLLAQQVRIGRWVPGERTPHTYGDAGAALGPASLGTSLLVVGPSGVGKTRHVIAPVVESLALQALTGGCAVVAVGVAGAALGPDSAFDVVVRVGDPKSPHDLDPYADAADADEAAALLAEALVGDLDTGGGQRAATALAQLLGPYQAAHGAFPTLPVLRELLAGEPARLTDLRAALAEERHAVMRRELDARVRALGTPSDPGPVLADRLALLDRPAFAGFFGTGDGPVRPFSLRAVAHHPLRVRIDLPEHGHEEAARLLTRLVLTQFTAMARKSGRDHFVCLVLDDATGAVTADSVRRIQGLRSLNAGVVLTLRTVADVPEALHGPLYGAVGCRMAMSGVTTWDGSRFAGAWGTEWVETTDVARHTVFADQPMTRALHAVRKMVTGKSVTTEAVTVRQVERERWSASELAHAVPPGHAVLSLTNVKGEHAPPLLVDLRG